MPTAVIDGIATRYEVTGSGPPLLMFSPGGFNAALENWSSLGIYRRLRLLDHLTAAYTCITFDRRESGLSGGRVERVTWADYAAQGRGLLDHLGIGRSHLMGGCAGCSVAIALGASCPGRVMSMVLYWPAGGAKYRIRQQSRFAQHLAFAAERGLPEVAALAAGSERGFTQDPRVGPWAPVIRTDQEFASGYVKQDPGRYQITVSGMARVLFDRDTVPGAEPEDLLRLELPALVIPGHDDSHATSAARYLEECLPRAEYWDIPVSDQTEETVPARIREFLGAADRDAR
ncbi:MAG TPA: alpha/beta hydrolase [Streptosporangiaceae bacterium]|nr:alpha/beta hydrolase [Streptosporangiaceae bacterium]